MELKFELDQASHHVHLPVYVNNQGPFIFALDTGAITTTLSKSLADKLGIETYIDKARRAKVLSSRAALVASFKLGTEVFEDEEVLVIDFGARLGICSGGNSGGCSGEMGGVIGHSTLKHYQMSVNYPTHTFRLEKSNGGAPPEEGGLQWERFGYIADTHLVGVPVLVDGRGPFDFVVDTGAGGTVITPHLAKILGIPLENSDAECRGIGGAVAGHVTQVEELSVASTSVENTPVVVVDMEAVSPKGGLIRNGIIGYPFLKHFELVIDYPNQRFALIDQPKSSTGGDESCCSHEVQIY